jgi:hypothetical protein
MVRMVRSLLFDTDSHRDDAPYAQKLGLLAVPLELMALETVMIRAVPHSAV